MNKLKLSIIIAQCLLAYQFAFTQVYTRKQTRHRFAQMHLGLDVQTSSGGSTTYVVEEDVLGTINLNSPITPRFLIGGTHFWGHADFYIAIPLLNPTQFEDNQEIQFLRGVETVFKYYPWRIEHNKVRPFVGLSIAPFSFEQNNGNFNFPNGPELNHTAVPILGGITFNNKSHLLELSVAWNYNNQQAYFISRNRQVQIDTPSIYATLSYRFMFDTTISAEKDWESGKTKEITNLLAEQNKLNGFFLGGGLSSAFWLSESSFNESERPFLENYETSILADLSIGYYLHKQDFNITLGYRSYKTSTSAYGTEQRLGRESVVLEATKYLFDYHGFTPFMGPAISYENLNFTDEFVNAETLNLEVISLNEKKLGYGITFGWDIRPNRIQSWILRTNLRWYPNLSLAVHSTNDISFNALEFNFIQLILYPNRIF